MFLEIGAKGRSDPVVDTLIGVRNVTVTSYSGGSSDLYKAVLVAVGKCWDIALIFNPYPANVENKVSS